MRDYTARDLLLPPTLVSLLRVPLAFAFTTAIERPWAALAVLAVAAFTDVADGWLARRLEQATPIGAVVDGVLDKLFASIVIGSLFASGRLSALEACLLGMREIGELPLVVWWAAHQTQRRARADQPSANWLGKVATVFQFLAIGALLNDSAEKGILLASTAVAGAASAAYYWRRELDVSRRRRNPAGDA